MIVTSPKGKLPVVSRDDVLAGDPVLRWVLDRVGLDTVAKVLTLFATILVPLTGMVLVVAAEGRLHLGSVVGPSSDHPELIVQGMSFVGDTMVWPFAIMVPLLFGLTDLVVRRMVHFFTIAHTLLSERWVETGRTQYEETLREVRHILSWSGGWRWLKVLAIVSGLGFFAYNTVVCTFSERFRPYASAHVVQVTETGPTEVDLPEPIAVPKWDTAPGEAPGSFFAARIWVLLFGYVWLPLLLAKLVAMVAATFKYTQLLSEEKPEGRAIDVRPIAPDGAGGLSPLANLATAFTFPMIGFGLLMAMPFLKEHATPSLHNYLLFVPFVPIFLGVFFLPLLGVHRAMREAKEEMIQEFASVFSRLNEELLDLLAMG